MTKRVDISMYHVAGTHPLFNITTEGQKKKPFYSPLYCNLDAVFILSNKLPFKLPGIINYHEQRERESKVP